MSWMRKFLDRRRQSDLAADPVETARWTVRTPAVPPAPVQPHDHPESRVMNWSPVEIAWINARDQQWREVAARAAATGWVTP